MAQGKLMKLIGIIALILVSVAFLGCTRPEEKLREFAQSECKSGIQNVYGKTKNLELGVAQLRRSALLGNRKAQFEVGVLFANGDGVAADYVEAYAWLSIALNSNFRSEYSAPGGEKILHNDREVLAAISSIDRQLRVSGMDVQLQAEGDLREVVRRMNLEALAKGKERSNVIRPLILDEVRKKLSEIREGK
jgi:hypothetical protein